MSPDGLAIAGEHDGAIQPVRLARQGEQTAAGFLHVGGLVEELAFQGQCLVASDDQRAGIPIRHIDCLSFGKYRREIGGGQIRIAHGGLHGAFVDGSRLDRHGDACIVQHGAAKRAGGSENDLHWRVPGVSGRS